MKKYILIGAMLGVTSCSTQQPTIETIAAPTTPAEPKIEELHPEVCEILMKIPDDQRQEFIETCKSFADKRNFDWRFILLIGYNESGLQTNKRVGQYAGIFMFGNIARELLGITMDNLLTASHTQQLQYAMKLWEMTESRGESFKIKDFLSLQLANFAPMWIPFRGDPYPADEQMKTQNAPIVGEDGEITRDSILTFYRQKVSREPHLKYFIGKI